VLELYLSGAAVLCTNQAFSMDTRVFTYHNDPVLLPSPPMLMSTAVIKIATSQSTSHQYMKQFDKCLKLLITSCDYHLNRQKDDSTQPLIIK